MSALIEIITSKDPAIRNRSLDVAVEALDDATLQQECANLDQFWRDSPNLYDRVRSLFFLATIYRFHWPRRLPLHQHRGHIPFEAYTHFLQRRFQESIDRLLEDQASEGESLGLASALAAGYRELAFQTLAHQVRRSVRLVKGNQWMFRLGHPTDQPLRIRKELIDRPEGDSNFPVLCERTAVRMDFSHSGWSDIFFLGMDYPDGARVINASIDLGVHGRDPHPRPPIETYLRVIDKPVLRLVSVDLDSHADLCLIPDVFDFGRDYLGLLKAAIIASGLIPPGMEGCDLPISEALQPIVGMGLGIEIVSKVNDIPKGSRLAVSTNLLGSLISICMRATGQVTQLSGPLSESDRRIVAARAILGEWIGGSGGGWQDSGGIWPGIKAIQGETAAEGDPEFGISRGRLLPVHHVYSDDEITPSTRQTLQDCLVLVHGGMAQNVGPVLEMVTEKYLLRCGPEWQARQEAIALLDEITLALKRGDIRAVGKATTRNFEGPLQTIIPWCTNFFTSQLIELSRKRFGEQFWGFWMLGGMAGGGMGFLFAPEVRDEAKTWLLDAMLKTKRDLETSLPFAMDPVVYDFQLNDHGTFATLASDRNAPLPDEYYALMVPKWIRSETRELSATIRRELESLGDAHLEGRASSGFERAILSRMLPHSAREQAHDDSLSVLLAKNGFDREHHETIRAELRAGRIGLAQNRLPAMSKIDDVLDSDVIEARESIDRRFVELGNRALSQGAVGVITLAAGAGSRWTEGAGVVKALHPFCRLAGKHRRFLEVHLAKTRRSSRLADESIPHVFTTGYLTDKPIRQHLQHIDYYGERDSVWISPGRSVGLRMIPTIRDLLFAWEEMPQQLLDEQQQKVRQSQRAALMGWARSMGEANDYVENVPLQCLHPVGHWYEVPNLLRNGTLRRMLETRPSLKYLLLHNVDTLGANLDPGILGLHIANDSTLSFEVINRRLDDRGGGLARVDGKARLVESLAMPREQDEFKLRYYNSMTTWISVDRLLEVFHLDRSEISDQAIVDKAVREISQRMPTYITIKDVKKRWGHGQEDIFPVTQFEKLWSDMSALPEVACQFLVVPLMRGQQLKEQAQLDGWLRDGSSDYLNALCDWS